VISFVVPAYNEAGLLGYDARRPDPDAARTERVS
jgi:hypothetical protein